jgi:methyl-accepting chemotaxis protein
VKGELSPKDIIATVPAMADLRLARGAALAAMPVAPLAALLTGHGVLALLVAALVVSGIAFLADRASPAARPLLVALALVGHCILFTAALSGHAWQIDAHMTYFAALAIVATMGSVPALVLAVAVTAVHHLTLGLLLPALVFPSSDILGNVMRTLLHAAIVLAEAAVLLLAMLARARAQAEVEESRARLSESVDAAQAARDGAERAREGAVRTAEQIREGGRRAAVAVEQVATAARVAAKNAEDSQQLVSDVRREAERSQGTVTRTVEAMGAIRQSSDGITAIVELIDEIARRTDLLALNAAVESARAGEAGRGFAVVANEVRKLSQQSADATTRIRALVSTSGQRVKEGAALVEEAGTALLRIAEAISDLDMRMRDISESAADQSNGLAEVKGVIERLDAVSDGDAMDSRLDESGVWRAAA